MSPLITSRTDWTPELLQEIWAHIEDIAKGDLGLDYYDPQFEVISAEQMIDAYASVGMPVHYNHWSFGKDFVKNMAKYQKGRMGLAYEIVVNTDPCVCYLMEENNAVTQTLVMAHAAAGHSFVFKNNYMFKEWTSAGSIIDYMLFAKNYIRDCEIRYGEEEVESVLDSAHALSLHGVDKRKRSYKKRMNEEDRARHEMEKAEEEQRNLDIILKKTSVVEANAEKAEDLDSVGDEENLLYFIFKNAPNLEPWKREILRIVYKIQQYFYPQGQCVTGDNLVSTGKGLLRLDELITTDGYVPAELQLLTAGDKFTTTSYTYLKRSAQVLRVKTLTGREYIGTPEHPLMVLNGSRHEVKPLCDMRVGDHLVLNLDYKNVFSTNEVALSPLELTSSVTCELCGMKSAYLPTHITSTHGINTSEYAGELSSSAHRAAKSVNYPTRFPKSLTAGLAELMGYFSRCSKERQVFAWSGQREISERISYLLNDVFGLQIAVTHDEGDRGTVNFSSWGLFNFLQQNNLCADVAGIPLSIRQSPVDVVISYVRALIDAHGVRRESVAKFDFTSHDEDEINQLQVILGALGVVSVVSTSEHETVSEQLAKCFGTANQGSSSYTVKSLSVPRQFRALFCKLIGSTLGLPVDEGIGGKNCYPSVIPGAKALIRELHEFISQQKKAHFASIPSGLNYAQRVKNNLLWNNQSLPNALDLPKIRSVEVCVQDLIDQRDAFCIATQIDHPAARALEQLLNVSKGCYYDPIVSVEELEETRDVYDVTVPENHLFWMSGLISHNTKTLNEGMATFTHFYIMDELEKRGLISDDAQMAWLHLHSNVIYQPDITSRHYDGTFNPYALGFAILNDVRRICENPTAEDREWFPQLAGADWRTEVRNAVAEHRDESFIQQYLSPTLIRKLRMFSVDVKHSTGVVTEISDEMGYRNIRNILSNSYNTVNRIPEIVAKSAKMRGDRTLTLEYIPFRDRDLHNTYAVKTLKHVRNLWGYPVEIVRQGTASTYTYMSIS